MLKRWFREISENSKNWIKDKIQILFYDFMVDVIHDELELLCLIIVDGKKVHETRLRHLPSSGMFLEVCFTLDDKKTFLIEKVTLSHFGSVIQLEGKFINQ